MEQVFNGVKIVPRKKPKRRNPNLLAYNIPPTRRVQKSSRERRTHKRPFQCKPTVRTVTTVIKAGVDWSRDGKEWNIPRNSDAPILDPDRHKDSKTDARGYRYYTPKVFTAFHRQPIRNEKRRAVAHQWSRAYQTWDQTEQNSEAHRSGTDRMEPLVIRRKASGSK